MADIKMTDLVDNITKIGFEPTRLLPLMQGYIESVRNGEDLLCDPSMPIIQLIELNIALGVAQVQRDEILNFEQYPVMAESEDALYKHMSDEDYKNLFATPSGGWFDLLLSESEILKLAVKVGNTGTRRITIPKHTQIVVNNTIFTFQYAINIIVKSHGAIDIVYDGSQISPLQDLSGNTVDWDLRVLPEQEEDQGPMRMVRITTFLKQMALTSYTLSPSKAKVTIKEYDLADEFYYVRAFIRDGQNKWTKIETTHSQQVFDANVPTLLLRVEGSKLTVELPYVYTLTSLVNTDIRVDVYTTKGPLILPLTGIGLDGFVITWRDLDNDDNGIYTSPLSVMSTVAVASTDIVTGGSASLSFEARRERMLTNAIKPVIIPISNAQMGVTLNNLGFDSTASVDDVSKRTYLASRAMPDNTAGLASKGVATAVLTMRAAMADILAYETVIDNGDRITVTPETLYRNIDGVLRIVSDADRKAIDLMVGDEKVTKISDGTYLYTPLHYVLDSTNNNFSVRPYFLDSPSIDTTSYVDSNNGLALTIGASPTRTLVRTEAGYTLTILTASNDTFKDLADDQVHVQLAIKPEGESDYAYVMGVQTGKTTARERIFEFKLNSHWDIDDRDFLTLTNLNMYEPLERSYSVDLHSDLHLMWAVSDYAVVDEKSSEIDQDLGDFLLPFGSIGVYHEILSVRFGDSLAVRRDEGSASGLWAWSRALVGDRKMLTYDKDVYQTQPKTVYADDPETGRPIVDIVDGKPRLRVKFKRGDVVLDGAGDPVVRYRKGDAILDEYGNPTYVSGRNLIRWWDICLFDGVYRYVTNSVDLAYIKEVPKIIVDWVNDSLKGVAGYTLDETELLFQPRNTLKLVETLVEDSQLKTLHTAQALIIDYYVSKEVYADNDLRDALEASAIAAVVAGLEKTQVSRDVLEKTISKNAGADIISVHLSGLGGKKNDFNVITVLDKSSRLCIGQALSYRADGTYQVVDSIEVNFRLHSYAA